MNDALMVLVVLGDELGEVQRDVVEVELVGSELEVIVEIGLEVEHVGSELEVIVEIGLDELGEVQRDVVEVELVGNELEVIVEIGLEVELVGNELEVIVEIGLVDDELVVGDGELDEVQRDVVEDELVALGDDDDELGEVQQQLLEQTLAPNSQWVAQELGTRSPWLSRYLCQLPCRGISSDGKPLMNMEICFA